MWVDLGIFRNIISVVKMGLAHEDVENQARAEKASRALEMRRRGLPYREIAKALGYATPSGAKALIDWSYQTTLRENLEEARELELERLDSYAVKAEELYTVDPAAGLDRLIKLAEQRCKVQGLYAPQKTEVTGKDGVPIGEPTIAQAKMAMQEFFSNVTPKGDEDEKLDSPSTEAEP